MKPKTKVVRKKARKPRDLDLFSIKENAGKMYMSIDLQWTMHRKIGLKNPDQIRKLAAWLNNAADYLEQR